MLLVRVVSLFRFDKKKKKLLFLCVVQYGGTHCSVVISGRSLVQNLKCLSPPSWNWVPVYAGSTAIDRCPFQGWGGGGSVTLNNLAPRKLEIRYMYVYQTRAPSWLGEGLTLTSSMCGIWQVYEVCWCTLLKAIIMFCFLIHM